MRLWLLASVALSGFGLSMSASAQTPVPPDPYAVKVTCNANGPAADAALSPLMPCDLTFEGSNPTPVQIQQSFDTFSWQSFVALNWPADGTTVIGQGKGAGGDAPATWSGWADALAVMMTPRPRLAPLWARGRC